MARNISLQRLHSIVAKALAAGARQLSVSHVRWDISSGCESPHYTELYARPSGDENLVNRAKGGARRLPIIVTRTSRVPMLLELHTPCRRCPTCKRKRQRLWSARALDETRASTRTWMGTFTLRPEALFMAVSQCRAKQALQGVDYDGLPELERLALLHAQLGPELTKMFKRIWHLAPAPPRYLCVLELHKSGVPHYHALLHEQDADHPIRHAKLAQQWPWGFSKWKLVDETAKSTYVTAYLSKSLLARVRASEGYGQVSGVIHSTPSGNSVF